MPSTPPASHGSRGEPAARCGDHPRSHDAADAALAAAHLLGTALCALANVILTRNVSRDEYGALSFFLSTINLISLIGLLGFQQTLPRLLSLYARERKPGLAAGFMITAAAMVIPASAALLHFRVRRRVG